MTAALIAFVAGTLFGWYMSNAVQLRIARRKRALHIRRYVARHGWDTDQIP